MHFQNADRSKTLPQNIIIFKQFDFIYKACILNRQISNGLIF